MSFRSHFICLVMATLGLTGCTSAPSGPGGASQPRPPDPWLTLAKGMTVEQLRATLGAPDEVRPMKSPGAEIWVYNRRSETVNLVSPRTVQVPAVDPRTGEMDTRDEPDYTQVRHIVQEELNLLMVDGRLLNWNRRERRDRQFD